MLATKDISDFPFLGREYAKQISNIKFDKQLIDDYILNILKHHKKTELNLIDSLQTFIGSFVVISNIHDHRVKTLFVNNLSNFYINKLKSMYKKDVEDFEVYFDEIFKEIFNCIGDNCVKRLKNNIGFAIKVPQFLKISTSSGLINHDVIGGYVLVDIFEILEEGFKKYFTGKLKKKKKNTFGLDTLVIKYDNYIPSVKKKVKGDILLPPCISYLKSNFQNPSHFQRLVMATYLLKLDKEDDEIVSIFSNTDDFNEKVTRYQLNQIKTRNYEMPNCDKIETNGFCFRDSSICGKCKNPIQLLSG